MEPASCSGAVKRFVPLARRACVEPDGGAKAAVPVRSLPPPPDGALDATAAARCSRSDCMAPAGREEGVNWKWCECAIGAAWVDGEASTRASSSEGSFTSAASALPLLYTVDAATPLPCTPSMTVDALTASAPAWCACCIAVSSGVRFFLRRTTSLVSQ